MWRRYELACDFLEDDLASGYVRVLQEMIAAGWADTDLAARVLALLQSWLDVLGEVAREAEERFGSLGPIRPADLSMLIGLSFLGGESVILLGDAGWGDRVRSALRSAGAVIRSFEEPASDA